MPNGPIVIHVIDTDNFSVQKTITFDEPDLLGIAQGNYYPFAYDPNSHTLFVGATYVVLAMDTVSDVIKKVIHLRDTADTIGLKPSEFIYINAIAQTVAQQLIKLDLVNSWRQSCFNT